MNEPAILDVGADTFQKEVIERSKRTPVLIDFWATWCGPCRTLGPLLEKLAREMAGRFTLAKVDIDKNPELADLFRITSVPSVLLLKDGKLADGFVGAQPEPKVRALLEKHLPKAAPSTADRARALEKEGRLDDAAALLREHLRDGADDPDARVVLARVLIALDRADEARKVFAKLEGADLESEEARAVRAQLELSEHQGDLAALERDVAAQPDAIAPRLAYGRALLAARRIDEGLEQLFDAARRDLHFDGDAPRKALLEAFAALGYDDPRTIEAQRRLSLLLCS